MTDDDRFNYWDPYGQNEIDCSFVTMLIEFQYDIIDSRLQDSNEFPDADEIIKRIQSNVR